MPSEESNPINITRKSIIKLLGSEREEYFFIPEFQRSYTWNRNNVEELVDDLIDAFKDSTRHREVRKVEYFLGTIISYYNEEEDFLNGLRESLLIDGQQRVTTLGFLLGELYKYGKKLVNLLREENESVEDITFENLRKCVIKDESVGESIGILKSSDEVVEEYLESYFQSLSQSISTLPEENEFNLNLSNARKIIEEKIDNFFSLDNATSSQDRLVVYERFVEFSKFLLEDVIISHVSTNSFADAFVIFERQNNRGEELLFSDIVKHYLMEPISKNREDFTDRAKNLNLRWLEVKKEIDRDGFSFDRFIIYFFRAEYEYLFPTESKKALKRLKEQKENNDVLRHDLENPEILLEKLEAMKEHFLNLRKGKDLNGNDNFSLLFIKKYFDFYQHYQVLMAMRTLEDNEKFERIAINLEAFIFISSFSSRGSEFEGEVINFIKSIKNDNNPEETCYSIDSCEDSDDECQHACTHYVICKFDTEHKIKELTMKFIDSAKSLIIKKEFLQKEHPNNTAKDWLKYIVYRIEHQYRIMADELHIYLLHLERFRTNNNLVNYDENEKKRFSINVDHILEIGRDHYYEYEQNNSELHRLEVENLKYRVGNLTLLTKYENGGRFNSWSPREKILGKTIKYCPKHEATELREEENSCRQNNCNEEIKTDKKSFDSSMFALTKALSRAPVTGRGRQAKAYRHFGLNYDPLGTEGVWDDKEIKKREKIQFHILSQALLINFNPYGDEYKIFNQINWDQFPPS